MLIQAKNVFIANSRLVVPGEAVDVDEAMARLLIQSGAAVKCGKNQVATALEPSADDTPNGTIPEAGGGESSPGEGGNEKDDLTDDEDIATFSTDMKADELRAAMRERGLSIRVGMTKAEMVEALNGGDDLPDIAPQDVVEE